MSRPSTTSPDDILAPHTPAIRALCERLRALVRDTLPSATEHGYPGWIEIYRRTEVGWELEQFNEHDELRLESVGLVVPMVEIYRDAARA